MSKEWKSGRQAGSKSEGINRERERRAEREIGMRFQDMATKDLIICQKNLGKGMEGWREGNRGKREGTRRREGGTKLFMAN